MTHSVVEDIWIKAASEKLINGGRESLTNLDHVQHLSSVSREKGHLMWRVANTDQMLSETEKKRAFQNVDFTFPAKTLLWALMRHKEDILGGPADRRTCENRGVILQFRIEYPRHDSADIRSHSVLLFESSVRDSIGDESFKQWYVKSVSLTRSVSWDSWKEKKYLLILSNLTTNREANAIYSLQNSYFGTDPV